MEWRGWRDALYNTSTAVTKNVFRYRPASNYFIKWSSRLRPTPVNGQAKSQIDTIRIAGKRGLDRLTEGKWGMAVEYGTYDTYSVTRGGTIACRFKNTRTSSEPFDRG